MNANYPIQTLKSGIDIVNGLHFKISTDALKQHLIDRAAYHLKRASLKETEALPSLKKALDLLKQDPNTTRVVANSNYHSKPEDQIEGLETDIKNHKASAAKFTIMAQHLIPNSTYILTASEMGNLEFFNQ